MKKSIMTIVCLITLAFSVQAKTSKIQRSPASVPTPGRNVQVGGEAGEDACGGVGLVVATTTLFSADSINRGKYDKVELNQKVYACDYDENADHVGIVIGNPNQNCQVSSPIEKRQDYKGPCKSGWIKKEFFESLAG
jgi:hypothetical protein